MMRLLAALVVFLTSLPIASAMFASSAREPGLMKSLAPQVTEIPRAPQDKRDLMITGETEIQVDGRACGLDQVPANAEVILLEVGADRSVIRRIHFQTRK
jgi:hypothetical protein